MGPRVIEVAPSSPFPIENIPFGIFSTTETPTKRVGTIIGDHVMNVSLLAEHGLFDNEGGLVHLTTLKSALSSSTLNQFASLPYATRSFVRDRIIELLADPDSALLTEAALEENAFVHIDQVKMHLPMDIHSFSDFLCSETHMSNGTRITGKALSTFYNFPIAYNGRTTSIILDGESIVRPKGMISQGPPSGSGQATLYSYSPSTRFDFELEVGIIISKQIPRDRVITPDQAEEHIFGFVLLNDWSARDIQFAEMGGMGPYNGKSTASTISPWVVLSQALVEARCELTSQKAQAEMVLHPAHLSHNTGSGKISWNIDLQASVAQRNGPSTMLCRSNLRDLYWTPGQMIAHLVSSGSGADTGDLIGSGTVSSPGHTEEDPTLGCLFELTDAGKKPLKLKDGREMTWLQDYDEVVISGWALGKGGRKIGFGEARGVLMPAACSTF